jgi:hypothetical protein
MRGDMMSNGLAESVMFRTMICDSCQEIKADATFNGNELNAGDCLTMAHHFAKNGVMNDAIQFANVAMITLQDKSSCTTCIKKLGTYLEAGNLADIYLNSLKSGGH